MKNPSTIKGLLLRRERNISITENEFLGDQDLGSNSKGFKPDEIQTFTGLYREEVSFHTRKQMDRSLAAGRQLSLE